MDVLSRRGDIADQPVYSEPYGHTYSLDVTVSGDVDADTGMVVNIKDIDQIVRQDVLRLLDKRLLNGPDGPLANGTATGEAILAFVRQQLEPHLPATARLTALRLEKTPLDVLEWNSAKGERHKSPGSVLATRVYEFSASHRLNSPSLSDEENQHLFGKCNYPNGHGHNYVLEVTVQGPVDPVTARVIDPAVLDEIVEREVVDRYDHRHLNLDFPEFQGKIPSSEVVTKTIWFRLQEHIPAPARLAKVVLRETARSYFEYCGPDR
jgi:6-pyruvoyltetrahydropterin/6-carboxytetrahydropterin synthase